MLTGGYEKQMIKLNYELKGHKKGSEIKIKTKDGIPIDPYWRERWRDSKIDKCIEFVDNSRAAEKKEIEKESLTLITKQKKKGAKL